MLDPIQRRRFGLTALLLSLIFFAVAAAAGVGDVISRESVASQLASRDQDCQNAMKLLGAATANVSGDNINATWKNLDDGATTLSSASAAAMACPGWKMTQFCMGQGCSTKGATLTMLRASAAS